VNLEGIHFLLTYKCTYECEHCFVWGSPWQRGTMTLSQVREVIDQAVDLGTMKTIYLEGGEPTLLYPVMLRCAQYALSKGLRFGIVTNCHWAESEEDAEAWLSPLKDMGISDLSLSSYPYFAEDLERRLLRNAVVAAVKLGIPMGILEVGAPAEFSDLGIRTAGFGKVMFKGRAAERLAKDNLSRVPATLVTCPHENLASPGRVHIGADGEVQVCQGLSIGNVFRKPLSEIARTFDPGAMPVVGDLIRGGPWQLSASAGLKPDLELYADECHLCYELRKKLRARFPDVLAPDQCYGVPE